MRVRIGLLIALASGLFAANIGSDEYLGIVKFLASPEMRGCATGSPELEPTPSGSAIRASKPLCRKPAFSVATAWAYSRWQDSKTLSGISYETQKFGEQSFVNDLERPVFEKFIFLAQLKTWLLKQSEVGAALMSGSGSTVFAVLREKANGDSLAARVRKELDREIWICASETI